MEFRLLGSVEVVDDDHLVDVGSPRQRALLALLALHPNRVVTSERILEALWGDDAFGKENAMWVAISRLRSALEPDHARGEAELVATRDHGYVLTVEPDQIDVNRFEQHLDAARRCSGHEPMAAMEHIDEALGLWRGSPVQEFAYEEFAQAEIARLEDRRLEALELRAGVHLLLGRGREQLSTLEQLLEQFPTRETFVELYMKSLYQAGRQSDALRAFDRHRRTIGDEMGLEVSPELARLEEQILLHDPAVRSLKRGDRRPEDHEAVNPFKGLRAFAEDDAQDFFGRDRLIADVVRRIGDGSSLVALVGASGSGKSSVVNAGLLPALRKDAIDGSEGWVYASMRPSAHPLAELEAALLRSRLDGPEHLGSLLEAGDTGLLRAALRILPADASLVLVIDQFEELFTLTADDDERQRFLELLGPALDDPHRRIRIVITLRADLYDKPLGDPFLAPRLTDAVVNVTPLTPDELEIAARGPLVGEGVDIEPALLSSLLTEVVGQPGALPLFQYTLTTLFDRRSGGALTLEGYAAMDGLRGALTQRADDLWARLSPGEQEVGKELFLRLVTINANDECSRRRVQASELVSLRVDLVAMQHVIETFNSNRLLTLDRDRVSSSPTIELAHEAMISNWSRLRNWVEEDGEHLRVITHIRDATRAWIVGDEDAGDLYRGARLATALDIIDEARPALSEDETRFLHDSRQLQHAEQESERARLVQHERQNRVLRRLIVGVSIVAVGAIVLGVLALQQRRRADNEAAQAEAATSVAETARLAAAAPTLVASNRRSALLLAAEAYRRDPGVETLGALQRVLIATGGLVGYVGDRAYERSVWLPDGRSIVGLRSDGFDVFDTEHSDPPTRVSVPTGDAIAVSPNGRLLAIATSATNVQLYELPEAEPLRQPIDHGSPVQIIEFSPDGATLATGDRRGDLRLFDTASLQASAQREPTRLVNAHPERAFATDDVPADIEQSAPHEPASFPLGVRGIAFSEDGTEVVTTGGVSIRSWSAATGEPLNDVPIDRPAVSDPKTRVPGRPTEIHLVDDGYALTRVNHVIQLWDLERDQLVSEFTLRLTNQSGVLATNGSVSVAFRSGSIVVAELDSLAVVDLTGAELMEPIDVQAGSAIANLAVSPDGRTASIAGTGGIVTWALDGRELLAVRVPRSSPIVGDLAVNSDGTRLAVSSRINGIATQGGSRVNPAAVWDLGRPRPLPLELHRDDVNRIWLTPKNRVVTQSDLLIESLDGETLRPTGATYGRLNNFSLAGDPTGRYVAIGADISEDGLLHVRDADTGEPVVEPFEPPVGESNVAPLIVTFNHDGTRLLVASQDGAAVVLDTTTWSQVGPALSRGADGVIQAAFSHDGALLATADSTGTITLRDARSYQPTGTPLVGGTAGAMTTSLSTLAFTDDDAYLLATTDGRARLWDVEARVQVGAAIPLGDVANVSPSSNGRWVPLSRDGILVYDLDPTRWQQIACRAAGRNLTMREWQQDGPSDARPEPTCAEWGAPINDTGG